MDRYNSHLDIGFKAPDSAAQMGSDESIVAENRSQTISPQTNGPNMVTGNFKLGSGDGEVIHVGNEVWLCRRGHSEHNPFCNDIHLSIGFQAD